MVTKDNTIELLFFEDLVWSGSFLPQLFRNAFPIRCLFAGLLEFFLSRESLVHEELACGGGKGQDKGSSSDDENCSSSYFFLSNQKIHLTWWSSSIKTYICTAIFFNYLIKSARSSMEEFGFGFFIWLGMQDSYFLFSTAFPPKLSSTSTCSSVHWSSFSDRTYNSIQSC